MKWFNYILINIFETLLRFIPIPCKTGIIRIGNPNGSSPVFLTGNFHLTVTRVKKALNGLDAYLLVANSRGINVWCAATGGLFTNHDVISVLKVSGIEELVDHRKVILPQLAGTGVESTTIKNKTDWKVIWGPVFAKDIPEFLKNDLKKDASMRKTEFDFTQRIEMAIAWAFPISVIFSLILIPIWKHAILPFNILTWALSFLIFISFPFYKKYFQSNKNFGRGGFQLITWLILMIGLIVYGIFIHPQSWGIMLRWGILLTILIFVISMDILGCTPIFKSGFHDDRLLKIILDENKCKGIGFCQQVCPGDCFEIDKNKKIATIPRSENCVQCGACIVQCPCDALYFQSPKGEIITPESIRKYKLNLMGKRLVRI
jgi:ferredoxin